MGIEIERKFLVVGPLPADAEGRPIVQGYLVRDRARSVRVRRRGEQAWLTIKGARDGAQTTELEYAIPVADAMVMLDELCEPGRIDKTRYEIVHAGMRWEVDVFHGDNDGLVVAEIELSSVDQPFERPPWVGPEVTHLPRYLNARLSEHPFGRWSDAERAAADARD